MFDKRATFSFRNSVFGNDLMIYGVDMSSYIHVDNKKKHNVILDEGPAQGLEDTTLTAEKNIFNQFY